MQSARWLLCNAKSFKIILSEWRFFPSIPSESAAHDSFLLLNIFSIFVVNLGKVVVSNYLELRISVRREIVYLNNKAAKIIALILIHSLMINLIWCLIDLCQHSSVRYRLLFVEISTCFDVDQRSMTIELINLRSSRSQVNDGFWNHWGITQPSVRLVRSHGIMSILPNLLIKVLWSLFPLIAIEILLSSTSRDTSHSWSLVSWLDLFDVWGFCLINYSCWRSALVRYTIVSDSWIRYWNHLTGHFFF